MPFPNLLAVLLTAEAVKVVLLVQLRRFLPISMKQYGFVELLLVAAGFVHASAGEQMMSDGHTVAGVMRIAGAFLLATLAERLASSRR